MFLQLLFLVSLVSSKFVKEEGIVVLNDDNFQKALKNYPLLLVEFYAPWCGHCKKFSSDYSSALKVIKDFDVSMALAKVDVTTSPIVTKEYKIQNLPTLKFFRNGYVSDYDGGLSKEDVISFMQRKSEPLSVAYYSTQELKDHLTKDSSVIVGYFEDTESEEYDQWESVLSTMENIQAVHITSEDIADDMSVEIPSIYFYNGIENPHQFTGSIKDLKAWISLNTLPLIIPFKENYAKILFSKDHSIRTQLVIFAPEQSIINYASILEKIAETYHEKLFVVHIASENGRLMNYFGISNKEVPAVLMINLKQEQMIKYRFVGELTEENLEGFVYDYFANRLQPYYKSEEKPTQVGIVKRIVSITFEEIVYDPMKNVLVLFMEPLCIRCKTIFSFYHNLATSYKNEKDMVIAQMDISMNDVEGVVIHELPTIRLYTAGEDGKHMIEYHGEMTLDAIKEFIEQNRVKVEVESDEL